MDQYLAKRRTDSNKKIFSFKLPTIKTEESVPQEVEGNKIHVEYGDKPSFLSRIFGFRREMVEEKVNSEDLSPEEMAKLKSMEDDLEETEEQLVKKEQQIEELEAEEQGLERKREGLLKQFFKAIGFSGQKRMQDYTEDEVLDYEEEALPEDAVEVIKLTYKWLEQLPSTKKRSFKASNDFQKYKAVLEKYGIARKKE
jgi:hypothetical protein